MARNLEERSRQAGVLEAENERLRGLLDEARGVLVRMLPFAKRIRWDDELSSRCYYCTQVVGHDPGCPIAKAKALLEKIAEGK